jgi:hypothetical protein
MREPAVRTEPHPTRSLLANPTDSQFSVFSILERPKGSLSSRHFGVLLALWISALLPKSHSQCRLIVNNSPTHLEWINHAASSEWGSITNFFAVPLSKSTYPFGASSSLMTVTLTAFAI